MFYRKTWRYSLITLPPPYPKPHVVKDFDIAEGSIVDALN